MRSSVGDSLPHDVIIAAALLSMGADRWRELRRSSLLPFEAPLKPASLLLTDEERPAVRASLVESSEHEITGPPAFDHCRVHRIPLQERRLHEVFQATVDAPAEVRAKKFPRAPFVVIAKRVVFYEFPRSIGYCGVGFVDRPRVFDCQDCIAAQKKWFREHPAPEQVVVRIPGAEPSPSRAQ